MPNTYTQLLVHLVFAVKGRDCTIGEQFRVELEKYMCGLVAKKNHKALAIYAMPDHVHFLIGWNPQQAISDLLKELKNSTSNLIKERRWMRCAFYWQEGYGAFSYSRSQLDDVVKYILSQPEHHRRKSFKEEYIAFLEKFEVDFKPEYLFEFYDKN